MKIKFYKHAKLKFNILRERKFPLSEKQIIDVIKNGKLTKDKITDRLVAERAISDKYKLRVFFEKHKKYIEVVTFYPTIRGRYENEI